MMFQQSRLMHTMEPMEFLSHRMSPHHSASGVQNLDLSVNQSSGSGPNKRQRVDGAHSGGQGTPGGAVSGIGGYDPHSAVNFFSMDTPSLVVSKAEYEVVKQEVVGVKRALGELRSSINSEIDQLKSENRMLKGQVANCTCHCRHSRQRGGPVRAAAQVAANRNRNMSSGDKSSGDDSDLQTSYGKNDESPPLRAYVDLLERENKSSMLRINELEKQLHQVRAASSRVPPIPSSQAMSFFRELMAYYTLIESSVEAAANAVNEGGGAGGSGGGGITNLDGGSHEKFNAGSSVYDSPIFPHGAPSSCSLYGLGMMPEAFDVEKGLQVQLLPNYNVWVSKSKLQFILKESATLKEGAPLFVLRRLIPLVFTWDELAASRGQGLNCKSTDDVLTKDPLDPTKVLVSKAYMRKYCLESGQVEPSEKSINETFSHQVNYARRKFKRGKIFDISSVPGTHGSNTPSRAPMGSQSHHENDGHHDNDDGYGQPQCQERA